MYLKAVSTAALLVGGLVGFNALMSVTETDIAVHHAFERAAAPGGLRPGDLIALSPDLRRMEKIGSLKLGSEALDSQELNGLYFNSLRQNFPDFLSIVLWTRDVATGGDGSAASRPDLSEDAIPFMGSTAVISQISSAPDLASDDECEMARRLAAGEPVCTVVETLNRLTQRPFTDPANPSPTAGGFTSRTVAITFAAKSNRVSAEKFAACGVQMTDLAAVAMNANCRAGVLAPVDTRVRHWLNVIDKRDLAAPAPVTVVAGGS